MVNAEEVQWSAVSQEYSREVRADDMQHCCMVQIYGQQMILELNDMRMFTLMCGVTKKVKIRNEHVR